MDHGAISVEYEDGNAREHHATVECHLWSACAKADVNPTVPSNLSKALPKSYPSSIVETFDSTFCHEYAEFRARRCIVESVRDRSQ